MAQDMLRMRDRMSHTPIWVVCLATATDTHKYHDIYTLIPSYVVHDHLSGRNKYIVGDTATAYSVLSTRVTITCARSTRPWTKCTRRSNEPVNISFTMSDSPAESLALSELGAEWERD